MFLKQYIEKAVNKIGKTTSGIIVITIITVVCLAVFGILFYFFNPGIINPDIYAENIKDCIKGILGMGLIEAFCFRCISENRET